MSDIINGLGRTSAFGALGLVLLILGIVLVDVLTPGKLPKQIWEERNRNAALLLSSRTPRHRRHRLHLDLDDV